MDNSNDNDPITVVEFCAGYGGLGLGIKRVLGERMRLIGLCELEGFAQANLISKMEAGLMAQVPIWSNLLAFPYRKFRGLVDFAVAGIPCQPHSLAGKRKGGGDERFLFDDWLRGLEQMQPRYILIENVEGLLSSKMPDGTLCIAWTIERLEAMGYKATAGIFSAREVGAPHQRKRVFIMAYDKSQRVQGHGADWFQESRSYVGQAIPMCGGEGCELVDTSDRSDPASGHAEAHRLPSEYREAVCSGESGGADADAREGCELANTDTRGQSLGINARSGTTQDCGGQGYTLKTSGVWPSRPGQPQHGWEPPRVVGNASHGSNGQHTSEQQGRDTSGRSSAEGVSMGDTTHQGCGRLDDEQGEVGSRETRRHVDRAGSTMGNGNSINWSASPEGRQHDPKARSTSERQTQPPLGGNPHGTTCGMDYAELSVTCDNRTDELRLLGNGVVPATAERAFRTLLAELIP